VAAAGLLAGVSSLPFGATDTCSSDEASLCGLVTRVTGDPALARTLNSTVGPPLRIALILAAARGEAPFATGIALGSAGYLVAAGLGAGLMLSGRPSSSPPALAVVLPGIPLLAAGIAVGDGVVTRVEGVGLVVMFVVYLAVMAVDGPVAHARGEQLRRASIRGLRVPSLLLCAAGVVAAAAGAWVLLGGGHRLLGHSGLSAGFIGAAFIGPLSALGGLRSVLPVPRDPDGETEADDAEPAAEAFATLAGLGTGGLGLAALIHPLRLDGAAEFAAVGAAAVYVPTAVAFLIRGRAGRTAGILTVVLAVCWVLAAVHF